MLRLKSETSAAWVTRACENVPDILLDHAHCEKKAASTALNMIFRYPNHRAIIDPLTRLAQEELQHFEEVLAHLDRLKVPFERQKPSPYAGKLMTIVRKDEPERLLDLLLVCAFIEARSCERMKLLAENLQDAELKSLYGSLLASEARHHSMYVDLALECFSEEEVWPRLEEVAQHEADVIADAPPIPRLHN